MQRAIPPVIVLAALVLAASACADTPGRETSERTIPTPGATAPPSTVVESGDRGWLDGEPDWHGGAGDAELADMAAEGAVPVVAAEAEPAATEAPAAIDSSDVAEPGVPPSESALRAGSVDDNATFDDFLAYLDRIRSIGIPLRDYDPTGRIVARVIGSNGLPVAGIEVTVSTAGTEVATVRTTADGTARFHPAAYGRPTDGPFTFAAAGVSADVAASNGVVELAVDRPGGAEGALPLDVLFLLDATGSMGDEIDRLKSSIDSVAERVEALATEPDARFAMTLYRDEGDAFVTTTFDFTSDVAAFRAALADVVADGGGDYPEALDEGLAAALAEPAWRDPAEAVQLVFLVADAPPQVGRQVVRGYPESITDAIARGLKVFPVASSESDDQAEAVFRQIAQATGARFVFLSYGAGGAATGDSTDIGSTDYEELALDDLVVRLIAEELADLTGDDSGVPSPTPTSTTVPPGQ